MRGGYRACEWDDVATRRSSPWFPYCSQRCQQAAEADQERHRVDLRLTVEEPPATHPEAERLVPFDWGLEFLLQPSPYPSCDELSEWREHELGRPWRERTYENEPRPRSGP